jgi:AraC family transcriptional regulator
MTKSPPAPSPISSEQWLVHVSTKMQPRQRIKLDCGATLQHFSHADCDLHDVPPCNDHLFAYRTSGTVEAARKLDAGWSSATTRPASITTVAACRLSSWRLRGTGTVLHAYISPALLRRAAGEDLPPGDEYTMTEHLGAFDSRLGELCERLVQEIEREQVGFILYTEAIVTQIAISLLRDHSPARVPQFEGRRFRPKIEKRIVEYIEAHRQTKVTLRDLADLTELGLSQFSLNFRATFGMPAYEFVIRRRIECAKYLLARGDLSLAEIALEAGFAHQSHLTRTFRRICGVTPSTYRRSTGQ